MGENNGKINKCLIININVKSQKQANKIAQSLMEIINSNQYSESKFQYHFQNNQAKFILNGSTMYLYNMMLEIDRVNNNEDQ